ncbi:hypothetical protein C8R46DRAFT_266662 [Mycena filopes]|nr:hypothetical protein C8R46DRAFT_266662 [Mycena filopes]
MIRRCLQAVSFVSNKPGFLKTWWRCQKRERMVGLRSAAVQHPLLVISTPGAIYGKRFGDNCNISTRVAGRFLLKPELLTRTHRARSTLLKTRGRRQTRNSEDNPLHNATISQFGYNTSADIGTPAEESPAPASDKYSPISVVGSILNIVIPHFHELQHPAPPGPTQSNSSGLPIFLLTSRRK